jgi:streptogramin lyase
MRSSRLTLRLWGAAAACVWGCLSPAAIAAPLTPGHMVFYEFFDGWHELDPAADQFAELESWNPFINFYKPGPFDVLAFDLDGALLYGNGSSIYRLNPFTGGVTTLRALSGSSSPLGFALEASGDFLVGDTNIGISRYSRSTGGLTPLFPKSDTFMPRDLIQGAGGRVFVTNGSTDVLELDPALGTTRPVTSFGPALASFAAVHPNGELLISHRGVSGPQFVLVDPDTGEQTPFTSDVPLGGGLVAFDASGRLWMSSADGLYRYESTGGARTLIHNETFFAPQQLISVPLDWAPTVPEPGAASLVAMAACAALRLSHRDSSPRPQQAS